ncbi:MAG: hypothetical protein B7C24_06835 [Bacteroidetes bacterium 4572_77]|nr:MAG: hypothetical protein B7C24_06835 [Bacteroidetes bacterium 4572_77]
MEIKIPKRVYNNPELYMRGKYKLENDPNPIEIISDKIGDNLYIIFTGFGQTKTTFEFFNTLKGVPGTKVFIRDINRLYYHFGISKDISSIDAIVEWLNNFCEKDKYENIICIGSSMGGFAALLFGALLDVDVVHAFNPQTILSVNINEKKIGETQWLQHLKRLAVMTKDLNVKRYFEVADYINDTSGIYNVYYCRYKACDKCYVEDLSKKLVGDNVIFHKLNCDTHRAALFCKEAGILKQLLIAKNGWERIIEESKFAKFVAAKNKKKHFRNC